MDSYFSCSEQLISGVM